MPDILDSVQKQINDAATTLGQPTPSAAPPPTLTPTPSAVVSTPAESTTPVATAAGPLPPPPPIPGLTLPPGLSPIASAPVAPTIQTPAAPPASDFKPSFGTADTKSAIPAALKQGNSPAKWTPVGAPKHADIPLPSVPKPINAMHADAPIAVPIVPPPAAKKGGAGKAFALIGVLLLLIMVPIGVFFISNREEQLADVRSRASLCCEAGECNDGYTYGEDGSAPQASCGDRRREACEGHGGSKSGGGQCAGSGGETTPTEAPGGGGDSRACKGSDKCSDMAVGTCNGGKLCKDCACGSGDNAYACWKDDSSCSSGGGSTPTPGSGGGGTGTPVDTSSCTGYSSGGTGHCSASDSGKCRIYSECCGPGRTRVIKATCNAAGNEAFDRGGTCGQDFTGTCGTYDGGQTYTECQLGWFYWITDGQCHDISQPQNVGGGSGNCTAANGCSLTAGQCIKTFKCSAAEVQAGTGFCIVNMGAGQANHNYQDDANRTCKTIQVDVYDAAQCAAGITQTSPPASSIIYNPPANCTPSGGGETFGGNGPVCQNLKVLNATGADITATLRDKSNKPKAGDTLTLLIVGGGAQSARFRLLPDETFVTVTTKDAAGNFTKTVTVPTSTPNNRVTIETELCDTADGNNCH